MTNTWEFLFREKAEYDGHSEEFILKTIEYANKLIASNLPVIFNLDHFAQILEIEPDTLQKNITGPYYKSYEIKKKSGGTRTLHAPTPTLKLIQRWIYINILINIPISNKAFGFCKSKSIIDNAGLHLNKECIINIDLKDFFCSIKHERVKKIFLSIGYVDEVSEMLTKLTTLTTYSFAGLPQGAPSSPSISNIIAYQLDDKCTILAEKYSCSYSRYADDITFSGERNSVPTIKEISDIIHSEGFSINWKKFKKQYKGQRQIVTGLTVSDGIHISKRYKKDIFRHLHFCFKFTPESHLMRLGNTKGYYKEWLLGRIHFVRSIEPKVGDKMLDLYNRIRWNL